MENNYWNSKFDIDCPDKINNFFDAFSLKRKNFKIVFIVDNRRFYSFLKFVDGIETASKLEPISHNHKESQFLRIKKHHSFILLNEDGYDFYEAANSARRTLSINTSIFRLSNHEFRYNINTIKCGVYEETNFYRVSSPKSATSHKKMPSDQHIKDNINNVEEALKTALKNRHFDLPIIILKAVEFHSHSLDSFSKENQLLDFWAIFESVLSVSSKHTSDRIQQICTHLAPILKQKYIYSLFEQLTFDIKTYSEDNYQFIIGDLNDTKQIVQRVCEFTLLEENRTQRETFLSKCNDFPLLQERITYYSNVLSTPKKINAFLEKHAIRVRWQIMRIYRNRNLIIHNGESMPYLNLLIENLHSYVDEFIEYVINSIMNGHTIDSMCQDLYIKECNWNTLFSNNKNPLDADLINKMLSY